MPQRIQRKRTKGWKMPANAVSVTRPGKWGNPYIRFGAYQFKPGVNSVLVSNKSLVKAFREYVNRCLETDLEMFEPLRGKDLACWCPLDKPCHADVLLEIANQ